MLILITGLPGTGKTTFARALAEKIGANHLNSDLVRNEMGLMGNYHSEAKESVYDELMRRTGGLLANGRTVVVDATFYKKSTRQPFLDLAKNKGASVKWIEIRADEELIRERVSKKRPDSEADFEVYQKIKGMYERLPDGHLILWSEKDNLSDMVGMATGHLNQKEA